MKKLLYLSLVISFCFNLSSCHADSWNPQVDITDDTPNAVPDKIPESIPDDIRNILEKNYNNGSTNGSGVATGADQDIIDYHKRTWNIPESKTIKRLQSMKKQDAFYPAFEEYLKGRTIAGNWFENAPEYKRIYLLKGEEVVPDWMNSIVINDVLKIEVRTGSKYSKQELRTTADSIYILLSKEFENLTNVGVDEINNGLYLTFYSEENKPVLKSDVIEKLEKYNTEDVKKFVNMPIKIEVNNIKEQHLGLHSGGAELYNSRNLCTAGFAIWQWAGYRFFVTAAHCDNNMTFRDQSTGERISTKFIFEKWDESRDYQLIELPSGYTPTNTVYMWWANHDIDPEKKPITSSAKYDEHDLGLIVCFEGSISGRDCGTIIKNDHRPNIPNGGCDGNGGACANTWVFTQHTGGLGGCAPGDSGAPVHRGSEAFGLVKSAAFTNGVCDYITYMPIHFIHYDYQDLSILYVP